jgi:dTDP-4-dehydrorhamnose reductase
LLPEAIAWGHRNFDLTWSLDQQVAALEPVRPRIVLNCAAYNDVDGAELAQPTALQTNGFGVLRLASACDRLGAQLVTYSTDYVFGGEYIRGGYREDHPPFPLSAYAMSKVVGEALVAGWPNTTVVRTSWVFDESPKLNFITQMLRLAEQGKTELTVTSDLVSRPTYATDLAEATLKLLELGADRPRLIHIAGGGRAVNKAEHAESIFRLAGRKVMVKPITSAEYYGPRPHAERPAFSVLNMEKLNNLGIEMSNWQDAQQRYLTSIGALTV